MVEVSLIASALLMGALLVVVFAAVTRSRSQHPSLLARSTAGGGLTTDTGTPLLERMVDSTMAWFGTFLLITFGVMGAVMVIVVEEGAFTDPRLYASGIATIVGIVFGTYVIARNAGMKNAWATMVTASVVGLLLLVGITVALLAGFGTGLG